MSNCKRQKLGEKKPRFGFTGKLSGSPKGLALFPMQVSTAESFDTSTNAHSLRVFSDAQVQRAVNSITHDGNKVETFDDLSAAVYSTSVAYKPTHTDDTDEADRDLFWTEFREVMAFQPLRESADSTTSLIFRPAQVLLDSLGEDMDLTVAANAVQSDFPTYFPTLLVGYLQKIGALKNFDKDIFEQCSYPGFEFVNGPVALAEIIGWAIREVSPAAFGSKWHEGRARPEEVAWQIHSTLDEDGGPTVGGYPVPPDVAKAIRAMGLENEFDFTAYKKVEENGGAPPHPSWPAMHSAASSASTYLAVILDLSDKQLAQAKLLDFCISYYRTVAGVHYMSDNRAGLALGQRIMKAKLPQFLADKYGSCDEKKAKIIEAVKAKIKKYVDTHDWATYLPSDFKHRLPLLMRIPHGKYRAKVTLKSWKGDYLHRPDSSKGVTTYHTGKGNEWYLEKLDSATNGKITLKSWKGDYLHRPDWSKGVTTYHTGKGNEWTLEELDVDSGKVTLKSWKGDYLHRPDSSKGVTTYHTGKGNEWTIEIIELV